MLLQSDSCGAGTSKWLHSHVWLGGWAQVGLSLYPCNTRPFLSPGDLSTERLQQGSRPSTRFSGLQNMQEQKLPGLPKSLGPEQVGCHFCHFLLVEVSPRASPDSGWQGKHRSMAGGHLWRRTPQRLNTAANRIHALVKCTYEVVIKVNSIWHS